MEPAIDRLMEVQAPTLVMVGSRDYEDIHKIADLVSEGVPGAEESGYRRGRSYVKYGAPR